jgi:hypothetical protein
MEDLFQEPGDGKWFYQIRYPQSQDGDLKGGAHTKPQL